MLEPLQERVLLSFFPPVYYPISVLLGNGDGTFQDSPPLTHVAYKQVLGRAPDQAGSRFWAAWADSPTAPKFPFGS
jgi:hypothetical protein